MPTFVLVHGGWHGGWCWRDVAAALRAAGHDVLTPTLSGLAERAHMAAHVDLSAHVEEIAALLAFEDVRDGVLVGHSYAGLVIAGAAARAADRVARMVYLDAFVAGDGQSLFDLLRPERRAFFESTVSDGLVPSPAPEVFGITEPAQTRWAGERLTPQPLSTFVQPLALTDEPSLPRSYVRCTQGPLVASFAGFADRLRGAPGWHSAEIATGHDAMVTRPLDVATLLTA